MRASRQIRARELYVPTRRVRQTSTASPASGHLCSLRVVPERANGPFVRTYGTTGPFVQVDGQKHIRRPAHRMALALRAVRLGCWPGGGVRIRSISAGEPYAMVVAGAVVRGSDRSCIRPLSVPTARGVSASSIDEPHPRRPGRGARAAAQRWTCPLPRPHLRGGSDASGPFIRTSETNRPLVRSGTRHAGNPAVRTPRLPVG